MPAFFIAQQNIVWYIKGNQNILCYISLKGFYGISSRDHSFSMQAFSGKRKGRGSAGAGDTPFAGHIDCCQRTAG
jgi:hypothetical protein